MTRQHALVARIETLLGVALRSFAFERPSPVYRGQASVPKPREKASGRKTVGGSAPLRHWVKVVRSGSTLSGYSSSDGVHWVQVGTSQTVNIGANAYIDLGVSSGNLATATFDNVTISYP